MKIRAVSIVLTLVALLVMCLAFALPVSAEGTLEFKVTTSEIINNKVTATVSIEENPGLASYVVVLRYDNSKFRPVYNQTIGSAVVDEKLFENYMDDLVSNSDGLGAQRTSELDYISVVGVTNMYNINLMATGDIFSIEFDVLDSNSAVFPCEFEVVELYTYDEADVNANDDGYAPLSYNITNADGIYTVKHHKELIGGGYETITETLSAPVGKRVSLSRKAFDSHVYDTSASNILNGVVNVDGTLVLECYYKLKSYTVTYNYQDATVLGVASNAVKHGEVLPVPDESTFDKTNYTFKGWYTEPNGLGEKITSSSLATQNIEIFAYWQLKPTYTVKHYLENPDGSYSEFEQDAQVLYANEYESVAATPNTYTGFAFASEKSTVSGTVAPDNSTVLELYYDRINYTVNFFDAENVLISTQSIKYQADAVAPSAPTKASTAQYDYTFTGWDKAYTNVTENLDIYPEFSETLRSYTVTYDYQGATISGIPSNTIAYGQKIILPEENTFSKDTHEFAGWYYSDTFEESTKVNENDVIEGAVTVCAKWLSHPKYIVNHYKENTDGSYSLDESSTTEFYLVSTETANAQSVVYEGFEENTTHADRVASLRAEAGSVNTLKLYYARKLFTVTFYDANGNAHDVQNVKYQLDATTPTAPTKASTAQYDYTFTGWDKTYTNVTENLDIYPTFSETLRGYTVTYDYQGATISGIPSNTIAYGQKIILPEENTFSKDTHEFAGWYYSDAFEESAKVNENDVIEGAVTVYAKWVSYPKYIVNHYKENTDSSYSLDEASTTEFYLVSTETANAQPVVYEGFEENTTHADRVASLRGEAGSVNTLKLYYSRKIFTVNFFDAENELYDTQSVKYQTSAVAPTAPTKAPTDQFNYIFTGWDKSFDNVTQNIDVYPLFRESLNSYSVTYDYQGATISGVPNNSVEYGHTIVLPEEGTFSKETHEFAGWYYSNTFEEHTKVNTNDIVENAVTVYAKWISYPKYIVNHYKENPNGSYSLDEASTTEFYLVSTETASAQPLTYEGFEENITHSDRVASLRGEAGSVNTLKLYYSRKLFTVNFFDAENELISTQTIKYQADAVAPSAPTKASTAQYDYTFTGWDKPFNNVVQNLDVYPEFSSVLRSYDVYYNYQGATVSGISSNLIAYGSNVILPDVSTFTKDGYNFVGWYELPNGEGSAVTDASVVTGEMTIYAYWEMPEYKVNYYKENLDGSYAFAEDYTAKALIGSVVSASDKNYTGFELDITNVNNLLSSTVSADSSTVLNAYYNRKVYDVEFNYQGATVYETVYSSAKYGSNIITPDVSTFSKDGYTFVGWFTEPDGFGTSVNNLLVDSDVVMYAYWTQKPIYTVEYYKEDISGNYALEFTETYDEDAGATVTANIYSYTGFNVDYGMSIISDVLASDNSTVLKVFYKRDEFVVKFYDDIEGVGNTYYTQIVKYEADATEPAQPFKLSTPQYDYTFTAWDKMFTNVTQNLDVYPVFDSHIRSYTVSYDYQGATVFGAVYSNTLNYGLNVIIPDRSTFENAGYNFGGWYTEINGGGTEVTVADIVTDNIDLYAYWTMPGYKVSHYKENLDGSYSWAESDTMYALIDNPVNATYKSYQGFTVDEGNVNNVLSSTVNADGSTELKVYYNRNSYTVKFHNANNEVISTQTVKYQGSAAAPQAPLKESTVQYNYTFSGWDKAVTSITQNLDVYPNYTQTLRIYTVTFDYQGATISGVVSNTVAYGQVYVLPATSTFSKTGYTFDAWYTAPEKQGTKIETSSVVTGDVTLYAGWNVVSAPILGGGGGGGGGPVPVVVKFNSNGGSKVENVIGELGGKATKPQDPTKEGYKFAGWYMDKALKNKYNFDNTLKAGITLYAAWEEMTEEEKQQQKEEENKEQEVPEPEPENEIAKVLNTDPSIQFIKGDDNGNFNPNNSVTRAEVSVMIYRLLLDMSMENETSFVDIPHDEWYSLQVKILASKGIIKGYEDGTFNPGKAVTRAEFAAILSRMVTAKEPTDAFSDVNENHWAYQNIATAYQNGWIMGYEDGTFKPDAVINRAEAVTILNRVLKKEVTTDKECTFPDVPKDHWAYYQICASSN